MWNAYRIRLTPRIAAMASAEEMSLAPNATYARMARGGLNYPKDIPLAPALSQEDKNQLQHHILVLSNLLGRLRAICSTVHPDKDNLNAFGNDIADTLILASIECESLFRDAYSGSVGKTAASNNRLTTADYVRLCDPMKLSDYKVRFLKYPWLLPLAPYSGWEASNPTKSLTWYDAYNGVKHDRLSNIKNGNIGYCLCSIAAAFVLICAQFGYSSFRHKHRQLSEELELSSYPTWPKSQLYYSRFWALTDQENISYTVPYFS